LWILIASKAKNSGGLGAEPPSIPCGPCPRRSGRGGRIFVRRQTHNHPDFLSQAGFIILSACGISPRVTRRSGRSPALPYPAVTKQSFYPSFKS
jgi:hypothetical protein